MAGFGFTFKRNVIVIGKTGSGKSTLINKMIGNDDCLEAKFSFSSVTKDIQQVAGLLELGKEKYNVTFIDTVGVQDAGMEEQKSNSQIISDISKAISERFESGLSLVIVTLNLDRLSGEDVELFKMLNKSFKEKFWKLAYLVFTHCDLLSDEAVSQRLEEFKTDPSTAHISAKFADRLCTVGFPRLDDIKEEFRVKRKLEMQRDVEKLHEVLKNAITLEPPVDVVKSCVIL